MKGAGAIKSICVLAVVLCFGGSEIAHAASATVCSSYAQQYAKQASRKGQILGAGVGGALLGAGLVAITGGVAAVGAAIGGGIGAIGGGSRRMKAAEQDYQAAYDACMAGKV